MKNFYVPSGIAEDYKYIVPANGYFDLYNTNYLNANQAYIYYRFYNSVDEDMYQVMERQTNNYNYGYLNAIEIVPQNNYIYRRDYPQILQSVFILTIGFVVLVNIMTSIIKRGGVLSGLL